jgi:hypothetical protein
LLIEIQGFLWSASSSFFARWILFPAARTSIRPAAAGPFDQCDQVEEELGRAQSKPTHGRRKTFV